MSQGRLDELHGWSVHAIGELLAPLADGRTLHHGWSPRCETEPSVSEQVWGVLKTTAIQTGSFHPQHNKRLPEQLKPRPVLEVNAGDLLITCAGPRARCGVPCLVRSTRPRLMISGKMYRFRVPEGLIDARYIEAFLRSQAAQIAIDGMKTGISNSGLNLTHGRFFRLQVPLAPFPEQQRIVDTIESYFTRLDDAVASLERVQRNLKRYRSSVLKAAVEGQLVPTEAELARIEGRDYEPASALLERIRAERRHRWEEAGGRGEYAEPAAPDTSDLPELPEGWCWATVDQLASEVRFGSSAKTQEQLVDGVPVLRMGNIIEGAIDFSVLKYLPKNHAEFPDLLLERGDLLFNRTNSAELVGKSAVFHGHGLPCSFASYLIRARFMDGIAPEFIAQFLNSLAGRAWIASVVSQQVGQANVNGTKLKNCVVPLPPKPEQDRIVAEVSRLTSVATAASAAAASDLNRVGRLRQAVLKWAFEGKLVDQDPSDEPGAKLLERIRAERQAAAPVTRGKPARGRPPKPRKT